MSYHSVQCHSPIEAKISSMSSWLSTISALVFFIVFRVEVAGAVGCSFSRGLLFCLAFEDLKRLLSVWKRVIKWEFPLIVTAEEPHVLIADPWSARTRQTSCFMARNFLRTLQMGREDGQCKLCINSSIIPDTLSSCCPPMVTYLQPCASKHFIRRQLNDRKLRSCFAFFFSWVWHHLMVVSSCDDNSAKLSARLTCFMRASPPLVFCLCWGTDLPFMAKQTSACEFEQLKCQMDIQGWRERKANLCRKERLQVTVMCYS